MTGTAETEATEFNEIYRLAVTQIPTNQPCIRIDQNDSIFKTRRDKYNAVVRQVQDAQTRGQPVLVGTVTVEQSEVLSRMLKRANVVHTVLNAKFHQQEAEIITRAGQRGSVTIATNMAGRGTDIKLGEGVTELGGLHILGTSRHESRRIDNQLRGRSGRQGDPGSSRFYLSLEDDLLRIFGSDRISGIMDKLGMEEDEPIEHTMISRAIENAQRKVEGHNFDIRKHLLEYDDVMNKQREVIYRQRREVLGSEDVQEVVTDMFPELAEVVAQEFAETRTPSEEWDWAGASERMFGLFGFSGEWSEAEKKDLDPGTFAELILATLKKRYAEREQEIGTANLRHLERVVLLQIVDHHWKEHLLNMDHLKEGIGLRGYGQKNPLDEYKKEGFNMFGEMISTMKSQTVSTLFRLQLVRDEEVAELEREQRQQRQPMQLSRGAEGEEEHMPFAREGDKVGRNSDCPCGSGKKYKRCCGKSGGKK